MHKSLGCPPFRLAGPGHYGHFRGGCHGNTVNTVSSRPTRPRRSFDWTFTMENSAVDFTVVPVSALKAAMAWRRRPPQSLRCCRPCSASCETLFRLGGKDSRRWRSALSSMKPASHLPPPRPTRRGARADRLPRLPPHHVDIHLEAVACVARRRCWPLARGGHEARGSFLPPFTASAPRRRTARAASVPPVPLGA